MGNPNSNNKVCNSTHYKEPSFNRLKYETNAFIHHFDLLKNRTNKTINKNQKTICPVHNNQKTHFHYKRHKIKITRNNHETTLPLNLVPASILLTPKWYKVQLK